jgi:hypothetical protein
MPCTLGCVSGETFSMTVQLDGDGFLRRECPTCEREFKWFSSAVGEGEPPAAGGHYCPYCAVQAPPGSWSTKAQIDQAKAVLTSEVVQPEIEKLRGALDRVGRSSDGFIAARFTMTRTSDPQSSPLTEADDMRRVDFECHPRQPLKVLDTWGGAVHCLVCGRSTGTYHALMGGG